MTDRTDGKIRNLNDRLAELEGGGNPLGCGTCRYTKKGCGACKKRMKTDGGWFKWKKGKDELKNLYKEAGRKMPPPDKPKAVKPKPKPVPVTPQPTTSRARAAAKAREQKEKERVDDEKRRAREAVERKRKREEEENKRKEEKAREARKAAEEAERVARAEAEEAARKAELSRQRRSNERRSAERRAAEEESRRRQSQERRDGEQRARALEEVELAERELAQEEEDFADFFGAVNILDQQDSRETELYRGARSKDRPKLPKPCSPRQCPQGLTLRRVEVEKTKVVKRLPGQTIFKDRKGHSRCVCVNEKKLRNPNYKRFSGKENKGWPEERKRCMSKAMERRWAKQGKKAKGNTGLITLAAAGLVPYRLPKNCDIVPIASLD